VNLQPAGLVLALVTFATIAAGHELVRRLHRRSGTRPAVPLFALGSLVLLSGFAERRPAIRRPGNYRCDRDL
jgi:hypothetical protein